MMEHQNLGFAELQAPAGLGEPSTRWRCSRSVDRADLSGL
jgi:hypothetical protein